MADTPVRSRRPYLLRAMHEWISDSNQTPHIVVDASIEGVEVPRQYVQGGKIILNVSSNATSMLSLGNEVVRFRARFGAATYDVSVPIVAVLGIYARETGQGMIFSEADSPPQPPAPPSEPAPTTTGEGKRSKPTLKVIK
ncbi:MAG TPA: ClpXP protease specificity-enhancing factor [Steroidobacteraceae bacterium]|jgi:stringent starvation protein B|nr:ClpXP protease specificity-enhancing factor [Steroidobacteraceae bacterium]